MAGDTFRAYSDPVIFRDDRVLRTLLKKETRYLPRVANFFAQVQTEVSVGIGVIPTLGDGSGEFCVRKLILSRPRKL